MRKRIDGFFTLFSKTKMELRLLKKFVKSYDKSDQYIQLKADLILKEFIKNPFHSKLCNHPLKWNREWQRSINVTGDRRIIFRELSDGKYELVELIDLWTHAKLYR